MDLELRGKRAVITGGSVGIGLAVAHALAAEGVDVAIVARDGARAEREASEIAASHRVKALGIAADVSKAGDVERSCARVAAAFDGVDILINNAGTGSSEKIMEAGDDRWQYYWDLHVMAAVRFSRALVPLMRKRRGGVILNTASICAKQPLGYEPIYNTTKAALVMFSKCLANELVKDGIRVNTINPGLVLTPDWRKTALWRWMGGRSRTEISTRVPRCRSSATYVRAKKPTPAPASARQRAVSMGSSTAGPARSARWRIAG